MKKIFSKLKILFNRRQKKQMFFLVVMMLIGAFLETISIALLIPAVEIVTDPDAIQTNRFLAPVYAGLGFQSIASFTVFVMASLIVFFCPEKYLPLHPD
jgi:ABC-type multidrug transport system fused ATPase/permease subunit